jgi:hypothetical protein
MTPSRKVLSIVGAGRSGTTILCNILGEVPGFFGGGELRWLWARDLVQQRVCGCGRTAASCPVWAPVVAQTLGVGPAEQTTARLVPLLAPVVDAQRHTSRLSRRRQLLASAAREGAPVDPQHARLTEATVGVLNALFDVTGASTVVDASKRPQEAAVLAGAGEFDHYVVHVVRDPRAVVQSWRRAKPLPEQAGRSAMPARGSSKTVMRWMENAAGAELLRRHVDRERWLFIRYEDFAAAPRATVDTILEMIGEPGRPPFTSSSTVLLRPNHNLSGNPSRFDNGEVRIVLDDRWKRDMPRRDRAAVTAATMPFLLRFGYPLLPGTDGVTATQVRETS